MPRAGRELCLHQNGDSLAAPSSSNGRFVRHVFLTSMLISRASLLVCLALVLCLPWPRTLAAADTLSTHSARQILAAHNSYRHQVGTPALTWSERLAARAQQWATYLIEEGRYGLRRDGLFGENLFEITGSSPAASPEDVVAAWASEKSSYHRDTNICTGRCGHYTQVVSQGSRLLGCGTARNRTREVWVCNYDPPGNIVGERPY